jgi:hypothetical protein
MDTHGVLVPLIAMEDLREEIIGMQDRRDGGDMTYPEDFVELARLEDGLRSMLGAEGFRDNRGLVVLLCCQKLRVARTASPRHVRPGHHIRPPGKR